MRTDIEVKFICVCTGSLGGKNKIKFLISKRTLREELTSTKKEKGERKKREEELQ